MILEWHEFDSPSIKKVKQYLEDRLASARTRNDSNLSEIETATLRGEIVELKKIIKELTQPEKPAPKKMNPYN